VYFARRLPLARITVEDCLAREGNQFALIVLATERARQLSRGAVPRVASGNRIAVVALREIAAGHVRFQQDVKETLLQYISETKAISAQRKGGVDARLANRRARMKPEG
jgi:DNA-directed RNA polymerase subunit omega